MNKFKLFLFLLIITVACKESPKQILEKNGMIFIKGNGKIKDLWLDKHPVTVAQFSEFVNATQYQTEADKFGDAGFFDFKTGEWSLKKGANWQYPLGKDTLAAPLDHPVTQVSWNDAMAYCQWANKRLPSSEEFVFAEKNGTHDYENIYTWGQNFKENGSFKANFWQGSFPYHNTVEDGFLTTSPVGFFGKNELGLSDMGGNVWQWCSDENPQKPNEMNQRGGSYLCDPMVCHGFKIGGLSSSTAETSLMHVGFRCAKDKM
jgi:formylglycine-generating enzyme